jgi:hypothetical protein
MAAEFRVEGRWEFVCLVSTFGLWRIRGTVPRSSQQRKLRSALHLTILISTLWTEPLDITEANLMKLVGLVGSK